MEPSQATPPRAEARVPSFMKPTASVNRKLSSRSPGGSTDVDAANLVRREDGPGFKTAGRSNFVRRVASPSADQPQQGWSRPRPTQEAEPDQPLPDSWGAKLFAHYRALRSTSDITYHGCSVSKASSLFRLSGLHPATTGLPPTGTGNWRPMLSVSDQRDPLFWPPFHILIFLNLGPVPCTGDSETGRFAGPAGPSGLFASRPLLTCDSCVKLTLELARTLYD